MERQAEALNLKGHLTMFKAIARFLGFAEEPICADCGRIATQQDNNTGAYRCLRCAYNAELFIYKTPGLLPPDKAAGLLEEYERLQN